ncbi:MAG: UvrD-helicase domain-containing protein, partial [Eggerthellaceae bacterium]|nr:UvrD-helicase domain-containing protein [Eggerthellaceae bacterium]
ALETGLSSDPPMNWRVSALDRYTLISNSDAHSPAKLAREASLFDAELGYDPLIEALKKPDEKGFRGTIEFFPEEGKYHFDGHRSCGVCQSPAQAEAAGGRCPVCGKPLTVGVAHRVEELADRPVGITPPCARHFESLVPLPELIASCTGVGVASKKVTALYEQLLWELGSELDILRTVTLPDIEHAGGREGVALAEGVRRLREGAVALDPGYDGEYGRVHLFGAGEVERFLGQLPLPIEIQPEPEPEQGRQNSPRSQGALAEGGSSGIVWEDSRIPPGSRGGMTLAREDGDAAEPTHTARGGTSFTPAIEPGGDAAVLDEEQRLAAFSPAPATLVMAGPGTGKTRALVARIIHLVDDLGVAPTRITAVTFTNKAAQELRNRLEQHFGASRNGGKRVADAVHVGTFHGIALEMLRQNGQATAIVNEASAQLILKELIGALGLKLPVRDAQREISLRKSLQLAAESGDGGLKESGKGGLGEGGLGGLGEGVESGLGEGKGCESGLGESGLNEDERGATSSVPDALFKAYNEQLQALGAMDFDDILLRAEQLAESCAQKGSPCKGAARFSHLLIDEFQDTNPVQYRLMRLWGAKAESLFVIGDPNQAIYGFRGADARCFAWLRRDFPGLQEVELTQNYRSTSAIVSTAVPVIREGSPALVARRVGGVPVRLVHAGTPFAEAVFVAHEVNRLVGGIDMLDSDARGSGTHNPSPPLRGFSDIAVLYRTNRQATVLEECLAQEGIPYVVTGRDDALAHPGLAAALAFFQLLLNPADRASLSTCLSALAACPPEVCQLVLGRYQAKEKSLSALSSVLEACAGETGRESLGALAALTERFGKMVRKAHPQKLLASWVAEGMTSTEDAIWVDRLLHMAAFHHSMEDLLSTVALGQEGDIRRHGGKRYTRDAVSLSTFHGAKGLEFPVVFLCGVTEGLVPLTFQGKGRGMKGEPAQKAEERHLLFVGMTRARDELILVSHGKDSPFLQDIPSSLLAHEQASPARKPPATQQLSMW